MPTNVTPKRWLAVLVLVALVGGLVLAAFLEPVSGLRRTSAIYVWYPDGTVERASPDEGTWYQACIRPDGTSVLFVGAVSGPPRVWKADLPGGVARPLTPPDSAAFVASWNWAGDEIVCSSDRDFDTPSVPLEDLVDPRLYRGGTKRADLYRGEGSPCRCFNLFVMDADGGNARQVTHGPYRDLRATFTPDGEQLTFFSTRRTRGAFFSVPVTGDGAPTEIPFDPGAEWTGYRPWYTPDAKTIYFFGSLPGVPGQPPPRDQALRIPARGGAVETIPWDDRGKTQGPFVDPSGEFLLFHSDRTGRSELYEFPLAGGEPRMLHPPNLSLPADAKIMHPTRSRNGVMAFDVSWRDGSWLVRAMAGLRWRLRKLFG